MTLAPSADGEAISRRNGARPIVDPSRGTRRRRGLLLAALAIGAGAAASLAGPADAAGPVAGDELVRLLRAMALLKAVLAAGAVGALWWRFAVPATPGRLLAYLASAAALAAGPVLVWTMVHLGVGSLLLHGGLLAALAMLWRDPAVTSELARRVASRRRVLGMRGRR